MHGGDIYRNKVNIDFSVNINPLGIPHSVKEVLHNGIDELVRYPDVRCEELKEKIAEYNGVKCDNVLVGNGASEIFMAIIHGIMPKKALVVEPSFSGYRFVCDAIDCKVLSYYLSEQEDFRIKEDFLGYINSDIDIIFIATPNNPTGVCIDEQMLRRIIEYANKAGAIVVIDECFIDFTKNISMGRHIVEENLRNVIVVKAYTKIFALPGLRLGYAICQEKIADMISRHLPEWNVSYLAQLAGVAALDEKEYLLKTVDYIYKEREKISKQIGNMGIRVFPSEANYILLKTTMNLYDLLLEKGILIRDCKDYCNLGKGYYRIAIRNQNDNDAILQELKEILKKK